VKKYRLAIVVSMLAVALPLIGSPVGDAVGAKQAKRTANYARNAGAVNGIQASRKPRPGALVPLGADGKFPQSVAGPRGMSGYEYQTAGHSIDPEDDETWSVSCTGGRRALGGAVSVSGPYQGSYRHGSVVQSAPAGSEPNGWVVTYSNGFSQGIITAYAWVICAYV
jgi:hypothetical protein